MISWITGTSIKFARLVVATALGVLGVGLYQLSGSSIDVYPEFDQPQSTSRPRPSGCPRKRSSS